MLGTFGEIVDHVTSSPVGDQSFLSLEPYCRNVVVAIIKRVLRGELGESKGQTSSMGGEIPFFPIMLAHLTSSVKGYQRADLITAEELALIKKVDRQSRSKVDSVLLSEGRTYALLYLSLLKKLQRVDTMQSLLFLIGDALLGECKSPCVSTIKVKVHQRSRRAYSSLSQCLSN